MIDLLMDTDLELLPLHSEFCHFFGLNESVTDQQTDTASYRDAWAHLQIRDKAGNWRKLSGIGPRVSGNHGPGTMEPQLLPEGGGGCVMVGGRSNWTLEKACDKTD